MDENIYKFYELYTEYGTLYLYEKYKGDTASYPETYEFFTNEVASRGYDQLIFEGCSVPFKTRKRDYEGYVIEEYMKELEPHEFLKNIEFNVSTEVGYKEMKYRTHSIFKLREKHGQGNIIVPPLAPSTDVMNNIALKRLTKFIK